jgi:hypothetical protein
MSRSRGLQLRSMLVAAAVLAFGGDAQAAELPLTRLVLSTSGIAQFTRSGPVTAGSTVEVPVRFDQVDDILKSLTVFDKAGAIGPVSLPGPSPLAELFRDLPFGPDALDSSRALVDALVGSEVEITGQVNAKGRVFRVEDQQIALPNNGGATARHRLTLMTGDGLVQAILEDVTTLRFPDPQVRAGARWPGWKPGQRGPHAVDRVSRRRDPQCRDKLYGRRADLEDRLPPGAAERRWKRPLARLGCA